MIGERRIGDSGRGVAASPLWTIAAAPLRIRHTSSSRIGPVAIELKLHLRGKEQFGRAISGLSKALDFTGTQVGLLIYADGPVGIHDDAISDPRICVVSLESFLGKDNSPFKLPVLARDERGHDGA